METIKKIFIKYKEIILYIIFGFLTTVVSLTVYYVSTKTFLNPDVPLQLQIANIISWVVGVLFAFFTNRKYVFDSNNTNKIKEFFSFVVSRISTLLADMAIMWLGVSLLGFNDLLIKIISQIVVIVGNYILSKFIIFKKCD